MRAAAAAGSISATESKELGWNKNNSIEFARSIFKLIMEILFVVARKRARRIRAAVVSKRKRKNRSPVCADIGGDNDSKTNTSTHCKLYSILADLSNLLFYYSNNFSVGMHFTSHFWHHNVFIIFVFGSFACKMLLDTTANNTVQIQFIQIERLRAHQVYIIKPNNDDDHHRRKRKEANEEKNMANGGKLFFLLSTRLYTHNDTSRQSCKFIASIR